MFTKFIIDYEVNPFEELLKSVEFENITNGRKGAILVDYKNDLIPIVRSTTIYNKPAQKLLPIHYDMIENIKKVTRIKELELNNALIEMYDSQYHNMGFHTDQSLDLAHNSYICIFSCYDIPSDVRKLVIKNKMTQECSNIILEHNSVIVFSTKINKEYVHKIVLDTNKSKNKWLGITFRFSKTFIRFINEIPYFYSNGAILRIANERESAEFRKFKSIENLKIDYVYPEMYFTISISDTLPIK